MKACIITRALRVLIYRRIDAWLRPDRPRPRCHIIFAVDIARFSSRDEALQVRMRGALYQILKNACTTSGVRWRPNRREDRGDGIFVVTCAETGLEILITRFIDHLRAGIDAYNREQQPAARIQLRMALHAGFLHHDAHGVTGATVNYLFRLLDAPEMKRRLADDHADFALILSDYLYNTAIGYRLIAPDLFGRIPVDVKETHTFAWLWVPPSASWPRTITRTR